MNTSLSRAYKRLCDRGFSEAPPARIPTSLAPDDCVVPPYSLDGRVQVERGEMQETVYDEKNRDRKRGLAFTMNAFPSSASAASIRCISMLGEHAWT